VEQWLNRLTAHPFDDLILLTREGLRRLVGCADRAGIKEPFLAASATLLGKY
jgi:uroporphyrinogen-III synthase